MLRLDRINGLPNFRYYVELEGIWKENRQLRDVHRFPRVVLSESSTSIEQTKSCASGRVPWQTIDIEGRVVENIAKANRYVLFLRCRRKIVLTLVIASTVCTTKKRTLKVESN